MNIYELIFRSGLSTCEDERDATAVVIARSPNAARTLLGKGRAVTHCQIIGTAKETHPRIVAVEP